MKPRLHSLFFLMLIFAPGLARAEAANTELMSVSLAPGVGIPVQEELYKPGGGASVSVTPAFTVLGVLAPTVSAGYALIPLNADASVSLIKAGAGIRARFRFASVFQLLVRGNAGYFLGIVNQPDGAIGDGFFYSVGLSVSLLTAPHFWVGADLSFTQHLRLYKEIRPSVLLLLDIVKGRKE